jgi:hypothetical protein
LLDASTTYQSPRAVAEFTKDVETVEDIANSNHRKDLHIVRQGFGGDLRGGPLEKGAQVYSTELAFAKEWGFPKPFCARGLILAAHGAGPES